MLPSTPSAEVTLNASSAPVQVNETSAASLPMVSTPQAVLSGFLMVLLFVSGLAWIQILFNRATPDGDNVVRILEYCSLGAGYCLLALPAWGIFDTLRRTRLYATKPRYIVAFGYVGLMGTLLYVSYKFVFLALTRLS